jgi:DNA-binding beta-propeller fold protein YncE
MWPSSVFVDCNNQNLQLVYVTEDDNYRVSVFSHVGKLLKSFGKKGKLPGEFDLPHGIVTNENGEIYISDHKNNFLSEDFQSLVVFPLQKLWYI